MRNKEFVEKNIFTSLLCWAKRPSAERRNNSIHTIIKSLTDSYHPLGKHLYTLIDEGIGHLLVLLACSHKNKLKKGDR